MLKMFNWFQKNKSGAAAPQDTSADDELYAPVMPYVISQFEHVVSESSERPSGHLDDAQNWAVDESVFRDAYLQGILFGLCKSLEIRNPQLEDKRYDVLEKIMTKLAGAAVGKNSKASSQSIMMANKEEFLRGMLDGYGEGLTIQSLQKHDLVLLNHLRRLVYDTEIRKRMERMTSPTEGGQ
jgi:hypothetical protein